MNFSKNFLRNSLSLGVIAGLGLLGVACSSSSSSPATTTKTDSGTPVDSGSVTVDGGDASTETLYQQLGGHAAIKSLIQAAVANVLMDTTQATYFVNIGQPGHPTADDLEECFTDLVGSATGGPEVYTTSTTPLVLDSGFSCRSLAEAHAALHIPGPVFDNFVTIVATTASTAGLTADELSHVGALLTSTKSVIVDPNEPDANLTYTQALAAVDASAPATDAATATDATGE